MTALLHALQDRRSELLSEIAGDDADMATVAARRSVRAARLEEIESLLAIAPNEQPALQDPPLSLRERVPRGPNAKPDNTTADRIINTLTMMPLAEHEILAACVRLGGTKGIAKATLRGMVKSGAVILEDGKHRLPIAEPIAAE